MALAILIQLSLETDCFNLNTKCVYSTQRSSIQFTAVPSTQLVGEEKRLCDNVINGQLFELQIHLGDVVFSKTGLTYNKENQINIEVACKGNLSDCAYQNVQKVQTATYTLIFPDIDLTLTSIVNYYEIGQYDHLSCIRTADLTYDGVKETMQVNVLDQVVQCQCRMLDIQKVTQFKNNVFITSKIDGKTVSQHQYSSNSNYSNIITFTYNNQTSHQASQINNFWQEITTLGPYNKHNLLLIGTLLSYIRTTPIIQLAMRIQVLTEIKQNRDNSSGTSVGKDPFYYNQSIEYSIAQLTNQNQADCFTGVDIELHKTFFYVNTAQNITSKTCTREYVENASQKPYDSIRIQIIASQNLDKSGFNYHTEHVLKDFKLGDDINKQFYCKDQDDCDKLVQLTQLHRNYYNTSVSMKLLFINNDTITFAISYAANFYLTNYNQTNISMLGEHICIDIHPYSIGSQQVDFQLLQYVFDLSQYMTTDQTTYCTPLQDKEKFFLYNIITKMRGNIDITPHTSLKVGNNIIGDVVTVVYQIPKSNFLVLVSCIVFLFLAVGGSIGVSFGFIKQQNI